MAKRVLWIVLALIGLWLAEWYTVKLGEAQGQAAGFTFGVGGDWGNRTSTHRVLDAARAQTDFLISTGDHAQTGGSGTEPAWCAMARQRYADHKPFYLVTGNHEDQRSGDDGYIDNFVACLPPMQATAGPFGFGRQQYWDYPAGAPLARFIMADVNVRDGGSGYHYYCRSGDTNNTNCNWLKARIDEAKARGLWVIVAYHKMCFTIGQKPCETGVEIDRMMSAAGVDLVFHGHDHGYQRSKQIDVRRPGCTLNAGQYDADCVADSDNEYRAGAGMAQVLTGMGGQSPSYSINTGDPDAGYLVKWMPGNVEGYGFTKVSVTAGRLDVAFVGVGPYAFADAFSIVRDGAAATPTVTPTVTPPLPPTATQTAPAATPAPTGTSTPIPQPQGFQPSAPWHGIFYYPWFQNPAVDGANVWGAWRQGGTNPPATWFSYHMPALGLYSSHDAGVVYEHLRQLAEARQEFGVASWWGQNDRSDVAMRKVITDFMERPDNPYPNFRWTLYYEKESQGNPAVGEIVADLNYIADNYAGQRSYFRINGRPVIFVYPDAVDTVEMVQRWVAARNQARGNFYLVLKVFAGYRVVEPQPDGWHQYAPAARLDVQRDYSAAISPGFWLTGDVQRLPRDMAAFTAAAQQMAAAAVPFKLVTTFNEWGENSGVERAAPVRAEIAAGDYLAALAAVLPPLEQGTGAAAQPTPTATATPTAIPPTATPEPPPIPTPTATATAQPAGWNVTLGRVCVTVNVWQGPEMVHAQEICTGQ